LHVTSLEGSSEWRAGEGRNNRNHGRRRCLGLAGNKQHKRKRRKSRFKGRNTPLKPALKLSKT